MDFLYWMVMFILGFCTALGVFCVLIDNKVTVIEIKNKKKK